VLSEESAKPKFSERCCWSHELAGNPFFGTSKKVHSTQEFADVLALTVEPTNALSVNEILERLTERGLASTDRDDLLRLLRLMDADHYLVRDIDGGYRFRFPLIRRWWKLDRGL
jgi:hypothetical protein